MRGFAAFYAAMLRISVLGQIQYRAQGAIWMIGSILEPVIFLVVWTTVAHSRGGEVGGYGPQQFAAYYPRGAQNGDVRCRRIGLM